MATLPMDMADLISRVREKAATRSLDAGSGLEADGDSDAAFLAARSGGGRPSRWFSRRHEGADRGSAAEGLRDCG